MTEKLDISNPISVVNEPKQGVTIDDVEEGATALAASLICVAAASALLHAVSSVFHSLLSTVSTVHSVVSELWRGKVGTTSSSRSCSRKLPSSHSTRVSLPRFQPGLGPRLYLDVG